MNDDTRHDDLIRSWIRSGPEVASASLVERTLDPVPRMRQRRSWRLALDRLAGPFPAWAGGAAAVGLAAIVVAIGVAGPWRPAAPGTGASAPPSSLHPTFSLTIGTGPAAIEVETDPTASIATCEVTDGGPWRVLYAGGEPFVSIDLLVGAGADGPGGTGEVAAEITAAGRYVRFDPSVLRGGDPPGRSTASVVVSEAAGVTTFDITALTPDRTTGDDGAPLAIEMTVACGPAS